jgi:hypothetical protein
MWRCPHQSHARDDSALDDRRFAIIYQQVGATHADFVLGGVLFELCILAFGVKTLVMAFIDYLAMTML